MQAKVLGHFRHNFIVNVLDGAFFGLGMGFASTVTVMPLFVNSLTDSTALIGLIASVHTIGWQLPQLLTSRHVAGLRQYRPMVVRMTLHERWPFLGLALLAASIPFIGVAAVLPLTFILLSWQALGGGFTGTAWQSMIGKIMPERRRGVFYGAQFSAISLLSSLGAVVAGVVLTRLPYPQNFALCFFLASAAMAVSYVFLWLTREPEGPPIEVEHRQGDFWHNVALILTRDGNFRWFLVAQVLASFGLMAIGFYTIYAVRHFGMDAETAGFMTGLMMLVPMITGPLVGWMGDRWGHRRVYAAGMLAMGLSILGALAAPDQTWFYLVFALAGFTNGVRWTNVLTITVEFGTETDRPYYIGLANTMIAPATLLAPLIGGALVDAVGFSTMFIIALVAALLTALVLVAMLHDPRALRHLQATAHAQGD